MFEFYRFATNNSVWTLGVVGPLWQAGGAVMYNTCPPAPAL